jgi:hypothetical protein
MARSALLTAPQVLEADTLRALARQRGPCITLVAPALHPGAQEGSRRALVHSLIRMAEAELRTHEVAGVKKLLAGLEEIAHDTEIDGGGPAFVIFKSPDHTARYELPGQPSERLVVSDRFCLTPFVADVFAPHDFLVLVLSRKHLRLFRYTNGVCREAPLPTSVPASLEAAGGFDQPDHDLRNRSSAGPSIGTMGGVQFGTQSDREALPEYLYHFFGIVDRGLRATFGDKLLLLMGVHEDLTLYRKAAGHPHFLESDRLGSAETVTVSEATERARNAARAHYALQAEQVLSEYLEMPDRARTLSDVPEIVRAAEQGRVHRLCVRSETEPGDDLINDAVVETLSTGGDVFMLPQEKMAIALGAILRY